MSKQKSSNKNTLFYTAVAAMVILVFAISFLTFGSYLQRGLLLLGAFILFFVATFGNQKVLQALQLIIFTGTILSFLNLSPFYALGVLLLIALLLVFYLFSIEHYKKEPIGAIGSAGFILLAIGLSFNNGSNPLIASLGLWVGSLVIAAYSSVAFALYKVRLQIVWIILNVAFAISPIILFFSLL